MRKLWQVALAVLVLVSLSPGAAHAQSGPYWWLWDEFNQGYFSAGAMGDSQAKWYYSQVDWYWAADGYVTPWGLGMTVVPWGTNPQTGEPAFVYSLPPDWGLPGQFDHMKWGVYMNHFSSYGLPGFDAVPGQELACEAWVSGRTYGTEFHPFGSLVQDPQSDLRLASYALTTIDYESGLVFDFFFTNNQVYALYERLPYARDYGWGYYAAFTYAVPVAANWPGAWHHAKIVYDRDSGIVRWMLDGQQVFQIHHPGHHIDRQHMYIDHGGWEQDVRPRQLNCGMGLFTLLDGYKYPGYWEPQPVGLVRLNTTDPGFYNYPLMGEQSWMWFQDEQSNDYNRLFGQGATMDVFWYQVSSVPKQYTVTGAVGVSGSDLTGANRLTRGPCPDTPFTTQAPWGTPIAVNSGELGSANWDCAEPNFYFGWTQGAQLNFSQNTQSITFTPPAGYTCDGYALQGPRTSESFSKSGNNCTVEFTLGEAGDIFLWFFVQPTLSYHIGGSVGIYNSDLSEPHRLTQGPCPGRSFITAADMGATTTVSNAQLLDARWDCGGPDFWYGDYLWQRTSVSAVEQTFHYTPPPGYTCVWGQAWGDLVYQYFTQSGGSCSVTTYLWANQGWLWTWFYVQPW